MYFLLVSKVHSQNYYCTICAEIKFSAISAQMVIFPLYCIQQQEEQVNKYLSPPGGLLQQPHLAAPFLHSSPGSIYMVGGHELYYFYRLSAAMFFMPSCPEQPMHARGFIREKHKLSLLSFCRLKLSLKNVKL